MKPQKEEFFKREIARIKEAAWKKIREGDAEHKDGLFDFNEISFDILLLFIDNLESELIDALFGYTTGMREVILRLKELHEGLPKTEEGR